MQTRTMDISVARRQLTQLDQELLKQDVVYVTRHGKVAFAVVNHELLDALLETMSVLEDPDALRTLQESIEDIRAGKVRDHEDVKKDLLHGEPHRPDQVDRHRRKRPSGTAAKGATGTHRKGRRTPVL